MTARDGVSKSRRDLPILATGRSRLISREVLAPVSRSGPLPGSSEPVPSQTHPELSQARVGGITRARWIRDICLEFGIPMLVMDMAGTVINDSAVAHFASTLPENRCIGTWSCQDMLTVDSAPDQGARNVNGKLTVPDGPGLGVEPDPAVLGSAFLVVN
ncbi:enolase C-terminal domain-like protein [Arthrobacter globiformis]|uniref:enolase C-terminal domain-like protein n=1 Tax=Arthrobacter globiformis TaxID=1665 RepID=UPI00397A29C3